MKLLLQFFLYSFINLTNILSDPRNKYISPTLSDAEVRAMRDAYYEPQNIFLP